MVLHWARTGAYFVQRDSTKNIQFPYNSYLGHYCLGIIYDRTSLQNIDETKIFAINELNEIQSVISHFQFLSQKNGKLPVIKAVVATQPILAVLKIFKI